MTRYTNFNLQLKDAKTGQAIITAGGVVMVCKNALPTKHAVKSDATGTTASNPKALVRGKIDFWVDQSTLVNSKVDLYIACPGGQFVVLTNVDPSGANEILVDTSDRDQCMVIPWDQADFTAAAETDTGFDEPASGRAIFLGDAAGPSVVITAIDATETIDVGTGEATPAEGGDANGFMSAAAIGVLGLIQDQGALMTTLVGHLSGGLSITLTTSAGSDTGKGFVYLPYRLFN